MSDIINKPAHYTVKVKDVEVECMEIMEALGLIKDFYSASAFSYLFRAKRKLNELQDLKKCAFYINKRIQELEDAEKAKHEADRGKSRYRIYSPVSCGQLEDLYNR